MWANPEVFTKIFSDLFTIHQAFEKHWDTIYFQQGSFYLVGGLAHFLSFHVLGRIIPTDELIFFRGVAQPPTSYDCYGNLVPLCTTGLSTSSLRRRFLRQRLAVQISIDLELFLGWSRLIFFKHSWEMLGMWGKPKEMSAMLAPIVLFMFFFPLNGFWKLVQSGVEAAINQTNQVKFEGPLCGGPQGTRWFGMSEIYWNIHI